MSVRTWWKSVRRRPLDSYDRVRLGAAAIVVLLVAVGATVYVNSLHLGERTYHADFAQAAGIGAGDAVTDAGIQVGTVTGTRLAGDHVVVTMKIRSGVALGADTRAAIKLTTLLGSRYLELRPAGSGTLPGRSIALSHTEVPYDLEQALQAATTTFSQVDADSIATSMTTLSQQLRNVPTLVPEVLRNVRELSAVIAARRGQIAALLTSTAQVTEVIRTQQADLAGLIGQGTAVLQQIGSRHAALQRMIAAATVLVHELAPIAVGDRPQIQQLLDNLGAMTQLIAAHDDLLRNILQILPVPWRYFSDATGTGAELIGNAPDGAFLDSWMCALSAKAQQANLTPYLKDCK
ncbi:MCE family protein [Nocardia sp. alder85J]|uniref:MCE family protein n=1 Tax=Nocardia sp. alder85J TaxID=2862949 RepID=UPI001CD38A02|nr:MCE family protein [Nocardia sp. alder85J]MCX4091762.1 MCE family protein [Nocardia sp. alder85J]